MPVRVETLVGERGKVTVVYGGVEIEVLDTKDFPWSQVFLLLLELGQQVWIEQRDDHLLIISKPSPV